MRVSSESSFRFGRYVRPKYPRRADDTNVCTMIYYRVAIYVYNITLLLLVYDEDGVVRCEKQMFCHIARV